MTTLTIPTRKPLSGLERSAKEIMFDSGQVGRDVSTGHDGPHESTSDWAFAGEIICSMDDNPSDETTDGAQAEIVDAKVRLPADTDITNKDRWRWSKRHGTALETPQEYEVMSQPRRGVSAITANLKLITGNSEN